MLAIIMTQLLFSFDIKLDVRMYDCVQLTRSGLVIANLGCQCDCIWNEIKSTLLSTLVRDFSWWNHLKWEDPSYIWATPSGGNLDKQICKKEALGFCLPVLTITDKFILSLVFSAYFFRIPVYTEDHLRHTASWTKQLLGYVTFHQETATVRLAIPC